MIHIAFVNNFPVISDAFKVLLENADEIEIVATFNNLKEIPEYSFDKPIQIVLVIFYSSAPENITIISKITHILPKARVLVLSANHKEQFILQTIKAGAKGYLDMDADRSEIIEAIYTLRNGHEYYTKTISDILLHHYISDNKNEKTENNKGQKLLSKREMEVLQLFAEGMSNRNIADKLFISVRTVETHKNNIMKKINLKNTVDLVKFAIKNNIIELD